MKQSDKFPCGKEEFKYYVSHKNDKIVTPLCIIISKSSKFMESFKNLKYVSILIRDVQFLQNTIKSRKEFVNPINKKFSWTPVSTENI